MANPDERDDVGLDAAGLDGPTDRPVRKAATVQFYPDDKPNLEELTNETRNV